MADLGMTMSKEAQWSTPWGRRRCMVIINVALSMSRADAIALSRRTIDRI